MTYTYTARNAENPDLVVTFTLENEHLRLTLAELLEKAVRVAQSDEKITEAKQILRSEAPSGALKLTGPVHVKDVQIHMDDDQHFKLNAWQRLAGLRLAPLRLNIGRIDNPEAAEAFAAELEERQAAAAPAGKFFGPLDYWAGWAGLLFLIVLLVRWPFGDKGQNGKEIA